MVRLPPKFNRSRHSSRLVGILMTAAFVSMIDAALREKPHAFTATLRRLMFICRSGSGSARSTADKVQDVMTNHDGLKGYATIVRT